MRTIKLVTIFYNHHVEVVGHDFLISEENRKVPFKILNRQSIVLEIDRNLSHHCKNLKVLNFIVKKLFIKMKQNYD